MSLLAPRAEYPAPLTTGVGMITAVKTEKASIGRLQLLNPLLSVGNCFTVLSPMAITFTKYKEWLY